VVFINQLREKVGVMYGNPETTTGGKALKFYATIRIDIRKSEAIKEGKEIIGNRTKVKIVKNKVAPPFRTCVVDMMYGEGISRTGEILDFAVDMDLIKKSGSFYSYNGERIGQGRDNARQFLMEHPEIFDDLDSQIRAQLLQNPPAIIQDSSTDTDTATDADEDDIDLDDLEEATDGKTEEFILDE